MKLSALLAPLIAAKASHATIMDVVLAYEAEQAATVDEGKEKARERWRRWKAKQTETNVGKRLSTLANDSHAGVTRVEDNLLPKKISGQKENKKEAASLSDLQAFRAELSELDSERLDAIVKHRRSKKGQLTALSARLFVKDAAACGLSLSEAVDACISRGWLTVKPEYFAGKNRATAPPVHAKPRNAGEAARQELMRRGLYHAPNQSPRLVDESDGGPGFAGTDIARRIALATGGGR